MRSRMREEDSVDVVLRYIIFIPLILITVNFIKWYSWNVKISTYNIVISGDQTMIVYQNDTYVEPGYTAYDYQNNEVKDKVKVVNNVDEKVIGEYKIKYSINNFFKRNQVVRVIKVVENPLEYVNFALIGESTINIARTEKYEELGYTVVSDRGDFTNNVSIHGEVNSERVGTYELIYTLRIGNKEKSIKRIVNVNGDKFATSVDITEITNQNVTISVQNYLKDFSHFVNPNGEEIREEAFSYVATTNGEYVFHLYDINGVDNPIQVNITNIDKAGPMGVCNSYIKGNRTTYNIEASDISGINRYVHNEANYNTNIFEIDKREDPSSVIVYDNLGNATEMICKIEYEYIAPTTTNLKYKYESETMKYWIENSGENYKTTHIWVKDAYEQMKIALPTKIGTLFTGKTIINSEIKNKGYENKALVAINASSIVARGYGNEAYIKLTLSWLGTAEIPLVINNGNIVRDSTTDAFPSVWTVTYGLKKDRYLGYYKFANGNDVAANTQIKEQIINDGVRYTFGFSPVLVWDGVVKSSDRSRNIRQGICQIDRNNFIIVTNINATSERSKGFSYKELGEYMVKQKCKIGFNLDGGNSVNIYYKGNTNSLSTFKSSGRGLVDMLYFVEQ